jgi:hypothetical protein
MQNCQHLTSNPLSPSPHKHFHQILQIQFHPSLTSPTTGNSTYAGATAAIVANIVLLSYEADLASGAIQPSEGRKDR